MANTLAYSDTATITAIKSFIVQTPGGISRNSLINSYMLVTEPYITITCTFMLVTRAIYNMYMHSYASS